MQAKSDGRGNTDRGPLYMDPYPLSRTHFLVAKNPDKKWNVEDAYGLYVIDGDGNKDLLFQYPEFSSWCPIPIRLRPKPPIVCGTIERSLADRGLARIIVTDVYRGLNNVARGTINYR